ADSVVRVQETTPFAGWQSVISVAHLEAPRPTETMVWRIGQPVPQGRFEAHGVTVNGKLYVFGGFVVSAEGRSLAIKRVDVYDPVTNQWTRQADMPIALTHAATAVDGNTVYFLGGYIGDHPGPITDRAWKYDTLTNLWSDFQPLPAPRASGVAVQINHTLHFFAGSQRTPQGVYEKDFGDHWTWDLAGEAKWLPAAPLPNPRSHLAAVALNGKIYALGGELLGDEILGNVIWVDVYDPTKDQWTTAKTLPYPLGHISSSTFVMCNRIIAVGGVTHDWLNLDRV
ncbi:MAG: glycosyl hydrolase, partial [Chloroflexi bacterium]|nr:glycosyl hydrolase [Chloroflexota bacterium]